MRVAGRTPEQIDDLLTERLTRFYKAPTVRLSIAEYRSQKVYVLGAVARPGPYVLKGATTLLDAVLEAGGTTPGAVGQVVLMRAEPEAADTRVASTSGAAAAAQPPPELAIDLKALLAGGPNGPANTPLGAGDMVLVPGTDAAGSGTEVVDAGTSVTVVGEVAQPGVFRLETGATALSAVLAAGGVTKFASPNRARVVRGRDGTRKVLSLQLGDIMKRGEKKKDVLLEPGDMVIVPARLF